MKRVLMAIAGTGLFIAAIGVARAHTGEDATPDAQAPSTSAPTQPADVSHDFDRELTTDQIKQQADQVKKAQQDIKDEVERQSRLAREGED